MDGLGLCGAREEGEACERRERRARGAAELDEYGRVYVRHAPHERLAKVHWRGSRQVVEHQRTGADVWGCERPGACAILKVQLFPIFPFAYIVCLNDLVANARRQSRNVSLPTKGSRCASRAQRRSSCLSAPRCDLCQCNRAG